MDRAAASKKRVVATFFLHSLVFVLTFFLSALCQETSNDLGFVAVPNSINTTIVTDCEQLRTALGSSTPDGVIVVVAPLRCDSTVWKDAILVVQNKTVSGPGHDSIVGAIDWGDADQVVVVGSGAAISFQDIIFMQDFLGTEGLGLPFLGAELEATAYLKGVAVGVRVCPRPVAIFDSALRNLQRPGFIPGEQQAFALEPTGLLVRDVAFSPLSSNSTWRLCNTLFRCGPTTALDPSFLKDFNSELVQPVCEAFSGSMRDTNLGSIMENKQVDSGPAHGRESSRAILIAVAALGILAAAGMMAIVLMIWKAKVDRRKAEKINRQITVDHFDVEDSERVASKFGVLDAAGGHVHVNLASRTSSGSVLNVYNMDLADVELGPRLGKGRRGSVYKCNYMGVPVAVKVIDHDGEDLLEETGEPLEEYLCKQMLHTNVVQTYLYKTLPFEDLYGTMHNTWSLQPARHAASQLSNGATFGQSEGSLTKAPGNKNYRTFIVMEYCNGGPLSLAIQDGAFFTEKTGPHLIRALMTALDVAKGMSFLHGAWIVHGDLKPESVLVTSAPSEEKGFICKVADFALSGYIAQGGFVKTTALGMTSHLAPELLTDGLLTTAADVYAYGILLWRLLAGTAPYVGMSDHAILEAVIQGQRPEIPKHFPGSYTEIIQHCWDADRTKRPTFPVIVGRLNELIANASTSEHDQGHGSVQDQLVKPSLPEELDDSGLNRAGDGRGAWDVRSCEEISGNLELNAAHTDSNMEGLNHFEKRNVCGLTCSTVPVYFTWSLGYGIVVSLVPCCFYLLVTD